VPIPFHSPENRFGAFLVVEKPRTSLFARSSLRGVSMRQCVDEIFAVDNNHMDGKHFTVV
jgi:hypothetical protein